MNMRPLVIGPREKGMIAELQAFAAGSVRDAAGIMAASGRDMAAFRDAMQAHCIELPVGYRVCYSHERQPEAPPPGVCAHLSASVDAPGALPSPSALDMLLDAFGMCPAKQANAVWVEEISAVERAVNVLQLLPHLRHRNDLD